MTLRTKPLDGKMAVILDDRDLFTEPTHMLTLALTGRQWAPDDMYAPTPSAVGVRTWKIEGEVCHIDAIEGKYVFPVIRIETPIKPPTKSPKWRWYNGAWKK